MVAFDWSVIRKYGGSIAVIIPNKVFTDEKFPFKEGDQVLVKIQNDKLIISKEGE
jgi:antitoxin component of MazEF toxin-antitoxin module